MFENIKRAIQRIDNLSKEKELLVVSHFDTDGITSAAIVARVLSRWGKIFSLKIVKSLDKKFINDLPEDKVLIFLDLASGSLDFLAKKKTEVIIFDHHEIVQKIPENVLLVNPILHNEIESLSGAAVCYLFAREVSQENKDLANLAVLGMVGDLQEKEIGKIFSEILNDSETTVKKGLMVYPSTRPLDRALEYSSNPFIPGVTGNRPGVLELLRDAGLSPGNDGKYKALYELTDEETEKLITSVALRSHGKAKTENMIGNLFLLKFLNKLEDARELSALVNACSRMGRPDICLGFCLGNRKARVEAEKIYLKYKQSLVSALKYVSDSESLEGKNYVIINARDNIKDTIIGTVASIVSHSPVYEVGNIIIALAYNENGIKVSARVAGREGRNVRDVLSKAVVRFGGEVGGHPQAAGCLISREQEADFIIELQKVLDVELVNA